VRTKTATHRPSITRIFECIVAASRLNRWVIERVVLVLSVEKMAKAKVSELIDLQRNAAVRGRQTSDRYSQVMAMPGGTVRL
jgi:hypothetical protein